MEFNYFKTSVMSAMTVGAIAFSASAMAASPVSVLPEQGSVKSLESFTLVFNEGDEVAWTAGSGNTPYFTIDGETMGIAGNKHLSSEANTLTYDLLDEWVTAGKYELFVPAGSYSVNGQPGDACTYTWTVTGLGVGVVDYTVSPATSIVDEIRAVVVSFRGIKNVTLAENLNTPDYPRLYLVNEDGSKEARDAMMPSVNANNLVLNTYRVPVTEPGTYELEIPGSIYFLDGAVGETIKLTYTIIEDPYPVVNVVADPAEGEVDEIETIAVTFEGVEGVEWAVTGTENAPYIADMTGNRWGTFFKLNGEGNKLTMTYTGGFNVKGNYQVIIPEGSYNITGTYNMPGKKIVLRYDVIGLSGYTVEPSASIVPEIGNFRITFHDAKEVTLPMAVDENGNPYVNLGTATSPYFDLITPDGIRERRGTLYPSAVGNALLLRPYSEPTYEPGEYIVVVPAGSYFLDGKEGEAIELTYIVPEPTYPEGGYTVSPAEGDVETIESIDITFAGVDLVKWAVTGTENAPYLVDENGERWGTFTKLSGEGNKLTFGFPSEFYVKGAYKVVVPDSAYVFGGRYMDMKGKPIELSYNVTGLTGIHAEPEGNVVTEIQNLRVEFYEAKKVTLIPEKEFGTLNTPWLDLVTEDGIRERRGTFFPSVYGNNMYLHMNSPITDPGEYIVTIPGTTYFLDGVAGEDVELSYTIVEPSYPDVEVIPNPAVDKVECIETIELTFEGVDVVEWAVTGTENAPYLADLDGNRWVTFSKIGGLGNTLTLSLNDPFAVKGEYVLVIPEGSYVFPGAYRGMAGKELTFSYEVLGINGLTVEPSLSILSEIQNVKITFNQATEVTLSEDLGTENTPWLAIVTEDGIRERRGTFFPSVFGNTMILTMRTPITEPGEYVVIVPGSTYFLDGNKGEDVELYYMVIEDSTVKYTVTPAEGTVAEIHTFDVKFDDAEQAIWNVAGMKENDALKPTISCNGGQPEYLTNLYSDGNVISLTINSVDPCRVNGYYVVTIPAGSYILDGVSYEQEIILAYSLDAATAVDAILGVNANVDVYDLNGRVVVRNADAETIKALRGIYVINGKKYILR